MKIFVVGLSNSKKTEFCKSLYNECNLNMNYIHMTDWVKSTFRTIKPNESDQDYELEFIKYLLIRLNINENLLLNNAIDILKLNNKDISIIEGFFSPKDFIYLFDCKKDIVVFLNRIDNEKSFSPEESLSFGIIKDYCYWLSLNNLLPKDKWIEYNFKVPGEIIDSPRTLINKNTVCLAKSLETAINHFKNYLNIFNIKK